MERLLNETITRENRLAVWKAWGVPTSRRDILDYSKFLNEVAELDGVLRPGVAEQRMHPLRTVGSLVHPDTLSKFQALVNQLMFELSTTPVVESTDDTIGQHSCFTEEQLVKFRKFAADYWQTCLDIYQMYAMLVAWKYIEPFTVIDHADAAKNFTLGIYNTTVDAMNELGIHVGKYTYKTYAKEKRMVQMTKTNLSKLKQTIQPDDAMVVLATYLTLGSNARMAGVDRYRLDDVRDILEVWNESEKPQKDRLRERDSLL